MGQKKDIHFIIIILLLLLIVTGCDGTNTEFADGSPQTNEDSDNLSLSPKLAPPAIVTAKDGAPVVLVPAGEFIMGSSDEQVAQVARFRPNVRELMKHEQPQHLVVLDAFYIDQYEVTNAQFLKFVEETGYVTDAEQEGWGFIWEGTRYWPRVRDANWRAPLGPGSSIAGKLEHPVVQVSYNDARAYVRWAGKRLPTEAEWEKASRGTDGRLYPWGNVWDATKVNSWELGPHTTTPVGSYPGGVSPYGANDMVGNVWEWVADWYHYGYYLWSPRHNPKGLFTGIHRVLRGGCWLNEKHVLRCAHRDNYVSTPDFRVHLGGFRCALDATDIAVHQSSSNGTWGNVKTNF